MSLIEDVIQDMLLSEERKFYGFLLLRVDKIRDDKFPTLFVTGKNGRIELHYNHDFLFDKTPIERCALIEHELLHLACGHFERYPHPPKEDCKAINIANDCAINQLIEDLPKEGITYSALNDYLKKEGMPQDMENLRESEYYLSLIHKYVKKQPSNGGCGTFSADRSEMDEITHQEVEQIIKECVRTAGNAPAAVEKYLDERTKKSKLSWKQLLSLKCNRAVRQGLRKSWKKIRKRKPEGSEDLKGKIPDYKPKVVVAIDTSGSIFGDPVALEEFQAQIKKIQEVYKSEFTVVECDADIQAVYKLKQHTKLSGKYKGGGGTDFRPVFNLCNKKLKPGVLVFLTDGYGSFPEKRSMKYPTIWCTIAKNKGDFPFGEVILIEPDYKKK